MFKFFSKKAEREVERMAGGDPLNQVDVCFVVDNTGSMGDFIDAAKKQLIDMMHALSQQSSLDLQIGLVCYRDHPPQDRSFVTRVTPLTGAMVEARTAINSMAAGGGGDAPEAVFQGIYDAVDKIAWREHSCRFVVLVGDAPPHGFGRWFNKRYAERRHFGRGDYWPDGCPSKLDAHQVGAALERKGITMYAVRQGANEETGAAFSAMSASSGGVCVTAKNADEVIDRITSLLTKEFKDIEFDKDVLNTALERQTANAQAIADVLETTRLKTAASLARLAKRGLLVRLVNVAENKAATE